MQLYYPADKYMIEPLKKRCRDFLAEEVAPDTVCSMYEFALRFNISELKAKCRSVLVANAGAVIHSAEFTACKADFAPAVLSLLAAEDTTSCLTNIHYFKALIEWARTQDSHGTLADSLQKLFPFVRFESLSLEGESRCRGVISDDVANLHSLLRMAKRLLLPVEDCVCVKHTEVAPFALPCNFRPVMCWTAGLSRSAVAQADVPFKFYGPQHNFLEKVELSILSVLSFSPNAKLFVMLSIRKEKETSPRLQKWQCFTHVDPIQLDVNILLETHTSYILTVVVPGEPRFQNNLQLYMRHSVGKCVM